MLSDEPLTRDELAGRIARALGKTHLDEQLRSGWSALLKPAANRGLLCQGPPADGNITFVDPNRWLGDREAGPDEETAARTLVHRFLDAYGPATHHDLARWFGVTPKEGRDLLAPHADGLAAVDIEGSKAWMTPSKAEAAAQAEPDDAVYLLPGFDPYVLVPMSHRDHTIPAGRINEVSRTAGWISPVLMVAGRIAGVWTHTTGPNGAEVVITPFAELPTAVVEGARHHLQTRYTPLLGPEVRLTVEPPTEPT